MTIYLPIAELSVNVFVILGMGAAVGFLSGMFGVGGGFLITPLLIFYNIPPAVAVATGANQVVASSVSGALAHFRRGTLDIKLGLVLLAGGLAGATVGIQIFTMLRRLGQLDLIISLLYVVFLGSVGSLMLWESVNALRRAARNQSVSMRKPGQHNWVHRLPFKMRFKRSKLYLSVIPVILLGFAIGILTSVMGVGGGFIMVPAMIYLFCACPSQCGDRQPRAVSGSLFVTALCHHQFVQAGRPILLGRYRAGLAADDWRGVAIAGGPSMVVRRRSEECAERGAIAGAGPGDFWFCRRHPLGFGHGAARAGDEVYCGCQRSYYWFLMRARSFQFAALLVSAVAGIGAACRSATITCTEKFSPMRNRYRHLHQTEYTLPSPSDFSPVAEHQCSAPIDGGRMRYAARLTFAY